MTLAPEAERQKAAERELVRARRAVVIAAKTIDELRERLAEADVLLAEAYGQLPFHHVPRDLRARYHAYRDRHHVEAARS